MIEYSASWTNKNFIEENWKDKISSAIAERPARRSVSVEISVYCWTNNVNRSLVTQSLSRPIALGLSVTATFYSATCIVLYTHHSTIAPVDGYFGSEFPAICNHCGVLAAWSHETLKICEKFLRFFQKRPFTVKFSKLCSKSFHRNTD